MDIKLIRHHKSNYSIEGTLLIDNSRVCDTVENRSSHLDQGCYQVAMRKCAAQAHYAPLIGSRQCGDFCRNCRRCAFIRQMNAHASERLFDIIRNALEEGHAAGRQPDECYLNALRIERALPRHAKAEPVPFCPQFRVGNGVYGITDCSITVGRAVPDVPGMVTASYQEFFGLCERIRKAISRNNLVTLTIIDQYK